MATGGVKSAERALAILELLTRHERPLTFTEIARTLRYPRSSLHGLLRTLVDRGWAEFDPARRSYTLGIRTLEAGNAYNRSLGLVDRALPLMEHIRDTLDETVHLAAARMREGLRRVTAAIDNVSGITQQYVSATEEMTAQSSQVSAAMESISAISEETAASAEEVSASTEEMNASIEEISRSAEALARMAQELQQLVRRFRV